MKVIYETSLTDFDFWCGAKENVKKLTAEELQTIEEILEEEYVTLSETEERETSLFYLLFFLLIK